VDGYDLSGYSRAIGPLSIEYDEADLTAHMSDTVKGYLANKPHANLGTLNAVFDNTATTGLHALMASAGIERTVLTAIGIRAAPAMGDPCFGGQFIDSAYQVADDGGAVTVSVPWAGWAADATINMDCPWGTLLHHNLAVTAVNAAVGYDNPTVAATANGGYMVYHVLASNAAGVTATLKVQDAAVNNDGGFADLGGCTTGVITCVAGVHGIVAATTMAVRQYVRWQIVLGTATSVTFVLGFFRKYP